MEALTLKERMRQSWSSFHRILPALAPQCRVAAPGSGLAELRSIHSHAWTG